MLLPLSNQDENTSRHWFQRVYSYTLCGGVLGAIVALVMVVWIAFAENRMERDSWIPFVFCSIGGAVVGTGCGLNVILRKVSGVHHFTICGAVMGAITALVIVVWFSFSDDRLPGAMWIPFLFCSIGGAVVGTGIGLWDSKHLKRNVILWFQQVFKTRLSKVLGSIFAVVFTVEFFLKADTDSNHRKIWEGILSGGWHGAVAVLMVLAGVVLWKLATKDAPKT